MSETQSEKKYLKWYNKLGYGVGGIAGNIVFAPLAAFVMIYLTNIVNLDSGIVGILIMVSKILDGVTDIIFGRMIDKTHSKMGKARPWMLWPFIGNSVALVAIFAIPLDWGKTAQYVFFFIAYTLLNAVFYTANNIAYSTLTSLITRNSTERVQLSSIRFVFATLTYMIIATITMRGVNALGGGAVGWRNIAIIYAVLGLIINTISVLSVKEVQDDEEENGATEQKQKPQEKISFLHTLKLLVTNKYFLLITVIYVLTYIQSGINGCAVYYMTYILGNPDLLGVHSMVSMLPTIFGLMVTPILVAKFKSLRTVSMGGYGISIFFRIGALVSGLCMNVPLMFVFIALAGVSTSSLSATVSALNATVADWTYYKTHQRIDGSIYSCSSFGVKVGTGVGTALLGGLLSLGGFINGAAVQPDSALGMIKFMYLGCPLIVAVILDDDCADFPGFNVCKHGLKSGSLEVRTTITVICVPAEIGKAVLLGVGFQNALLERDLSRVFSPRYITLYQKAK